MYLYFVEYLSYQRHFKLKYIYFYMYIFIYIRPMFDIVCFVL